MSATTFQSWLDACDAVITERFNAGAVSSYSTAGQSVSLEPIGDLLDARGTVQRLLSEAKRESGIMLVRLTPRK